MDCYGDGGFLYPSVFGDRHERPGHIHLARWNIIVEAPAFCIFLGELEKAIFYHYDGEHVYNLRHCNCYKVSCITGVTSALIVGPFCWALTCGTGCTYCIPLLSRWQTLKEQWVSLGALDFRRRVATVQNKAIQIRRYVLYSVLGLGIPIANVVLASAIEWR